MTQMRLRFCAGLSESWLLTNIQNMEGDGRLRPKFLHGVPLCSCARLVKYQRTCNGLAVFWPTMDLAEI